MLKLYLNRKFLEFPLNILIFITTFALSFINNGAKIYKIYVRIKKSWRKIMNNAEILS